MPQGGGDYNKRWYSFSYGIYHFIVLDSIVSLNSKLFKEETQWLMNDLEKIKKNIVLFFTIILSGIILHISGENKIQN
ncbi:hypothetical protein [Marinitoga lauensis]|uniref:hypothetical protein n=1 Tax=Marinitoga lauensis TaxID=2201189 RepID=UPI001013BEDE|nr:hypothetical protein [Marinitoga lauensis]